MSMSMMPMQVDCFIYNSLPNIGIAIYIGTHVAGYICAQTSQSIGRGLAQLAPIIDDWTHIGSENLLTN